MDPDLVLRLESKVDQLLARLQLLEQENERVAAENRDLLAQRQRFAAELDRILGKLDRLDRGDF